MTSSDGFSFDFEVYTGKEALLILENWWGKALSSVLLNKLTIQMSTAFTQLTKANLLPLTKEKGIRHTDTVRQNRIGKCPRICSKEFKTERVKYKGFGTGGLVLVN